MVAVLVRRHSISTFQLLFYGSLIPSVILHEVSHGAVALAFGDDTAKRAGRLTLNPIPHIDPVGTVVLPVLLSLSGAGVFGWARPVPVNVSKLRHPRNDDVVVALVGPAVNVALAILFGFAYRYGVPAAIQQAAAFNFNSQPWWAQLLFFFGEVNVILAVFNLIPLPPLDGAAVVERLLPARLLPDYYRIRPYTLVLPLVLVLLFPGALQHLFSVAFTWWATVVGLI